MYKAERMSLDRISTLPEPVLETILCLLPTTEEAARTSILSTEWRYKWTKIPKLELSHSWRCDSASKLTSGIASSRRNVNTRCKCCYDMQHILLLRQGPIHELNFLMPVNDCLGLNPILLHLSRNHPVKKLALYSWDFYSGYKLPISLFAFHHLTDLNIFGLDLNHPPIFDGFRNLKSLCLTSVGISTKTLLHLLSNCPSLKTLTLLVSPDGECTVTELLECLPVIEHLTTWPRVSEWLILDSIPPEVPTSLIHLKDICFEEITRVHGYVLAFLLVLIKCSPNLEKIKLEGYSDNDDGEKYPVVWEEYSDVWLEHLNELETACFSNSKPEIEFVKFILARSPKLKKVSIYSIVDWNQESEMLKTLLQATHVSPVVITVQ